MNRFELENIKILVNEYDVDSQIFRGGKLVKQYYGGVIYDYNIFNSQSNFEHKKIPYIPVVLLEYRKNTSSFLFRSNQFYE